MIENNLVLKNHIKDYRKKLKLNQSELANMVGVSRQTISHIENNTFSPSAKLALLISIAFDVQFEKLFYFWYDIILERDKSTYLLY